MTPDLSSVNEAQLRRLPLARLRQFVIALKGLPTASAAVSLQFGREDPADFIRDVLGAKPSAEAIKHGYHDPWTPQQKRVMDSVRDNRKTRVPSGHGTGKTKLMAWLCLWWLYRRPRSVVITTAPTFTQVAKQLWREIGATFASSVMKLPGKRSMLELTLDEKAYAIGLTTTPQQGDISAARFAGFHSDNVLIAVDEAAGVVEEIYEGGEGIAIGPEDRWLIGGNPTIPTSHFVQLENNPAWNTVHLDSTQHPNVIHRNHRIVPGAVTAEWCEDRLEEYGSEDSPLYKAKVLGIAPKQTSDALISLDYIETAQRRRLQIDERKEAGTWKSDRKGAALGLDVAGEGTDLTNAWLVEEDCAFMPEVDGKRAWHVGRDVMEAVTLVLQLLREFPQIRVLAMDDTGLGQGVSARLRQLQREGKIPRFDPNPKPEHPGKGRSLWLVPLNFGANSSQPDRFADVKDELWWGVREELRNGPLALPSDEELAGYGLPKGNSLLTQLTTPIYGPDASGRIVVWDKRDARGGSPDEKTRERIRLLPAKSPDLGHALALAVLAWKKLRPGATPDPPKDLQELFDRNTREMIERVTGQKDPSRPRLTDGRKAGPLAPWQRRKR